MFKKILRKIREFLKKFFQIVKRLFQGRTISVECRRLLGAKNLIEKALQEAVKKNKKGDIKAYRSILDLIPDEEDILSGKVRDVTIPKDLWESIKDKVALGPIVEEIQDITTIKKLLKAHGPLDVSNVLVLLKFSDKYKVIGDIPILPDSSLPYGKYFRYKDKPAVILINPDNTLDEIKLIMEHEVQNAYDDYRGKEITEYRPNLRNLMTQIKEKPSLTDSDIKRWMKKHTPKLSQSEKDRLFKGAVKYRNMLKPTKKISKITGRDLQKARLEWKKTEKRINEIQKKYFDKRWDLVKKVKPSVEEKSTVRKLEEEFLKMRKDHLTAHSNYLHIEAQYRLSPIVELPTTPALQEIIDQVIKNIPKKTEDINYLFRLYRQGEALKMAIDERLSYEKITQAMKDMELPIVPEEIADRFAVDFHSVKVKLVVATKPVDIDNILQQYRNAFDFCQGPNLSALLTDLKNKVPLDNIIRLIDGKIAYGKGGIAPVIAPNFIQGYLAETPAFIKALPRIAQAPIVSTKIPAFIGTEWNYTTLKPKISIPTTQEMLPISIGENAGSLVLRKAIGKTPISTTNWFDFNSSLYRLTAYDPASKTFFECIGNIRENTTLMTRFNIQTGNYTLLGKGYAIKTAPKGMGAKSIVDPTGRVMANIGRDGQLLSPSTNKPILDPSKRQIYMAKKVTGIKYQPITYASGAKTGLYKDPLTGKALTEVEMRALPKTREIALNIRQVEHTTPNWFKNEIRTYKQSFKLYFNLVKTKPKVALATTVRSLGGHILGWATYIAVSEIIGGTLGLNANERNLIRDMKYTQYAQTGVVPTFKETVKTLQQWEANKNIPTAQDWQEQIKVAKNIPTNVRNEAIVRIGQLQKQFLRKKGVYDVLKTPESVERYIQEHSKEWSYFYADNVPDPGKKQYEKVFGWKKMSPEERDFETTVYEIMASQFNGWAKSSITGKFYFRGLSERTFDKIGMVLTNGTLEEAIKETAWKANIDAGIEYIDHIGARLAQRPMYERIISGALTFGITPLLELRGKATPEYYQKVGQVLTPEVLANVDSIRKFLKENAELMGTRTIEGKKVKFSDLVNAGFLKDDKFVMGEMRNLNTLISVAKLGDNVNKSLEYIDSYRDLVAESDPYTVAEIMKASERLAPMRLLGLPYTTIEEDGKKIKGISEYTVKELAKATGLPEQECKHYKRYVDFSLKSLRPLSPTEIKDYLKSRDSASLSEYLDGLGVDEISEIAREKTGAEIKEWIDALSPDELTKIIGHPQVENIGRLTEKELTEWIALQKGHLSDILYKGDITGQQWSADLTRLLTTKLIFEAEAKEVKERYGFDISEDMPIGVAREIIGYQVCANYLAKRGYDMEKLALLSLAELEDYTNKLVAQEAYERRQSLIKTIVEVFPDQARKEFITPGEIKCENWEQLEKALQEGKVPTELVYVVTETIKDARGKLALKEALYKEEIRLRKAGYEEEADQYKKQAEQIVADVKIPAKLEEILTKGEYRQDELKEVLGTLTDEQLEEVGKRMSLIRQIESLPEAHRPRGDMGKLASTELKEELDRALSFPIDIEHFTECQIDIIKDIMAGLGTEIIGEAELQRMRQEMTPGDLERFANKLWETKEITHDDIKEVIAKAWDVKPEDVTVTYEDKDQDGIAERTGWEIKDRYGDLGVRYDEESGTYSIWTAKAGYFTGLGAGELETATDLADFLSMEDREEAFEAYLSDRADQMREEGYSEEQIEAWEDRTADMWDELKDWYLEAKGPSGETEGGGEEDEEGEGEDTSQTRLMRIPSPWDKGLPAFLEKIADLPGPKEKPFFGEVPTTPEEVSVLPSPIMKTPLSELPTTLKVSPELPTVGAEEPVPSEPSITPIEGMVSKEDIGIQGSIAEATAETVSGFNPLMIKSVDEVQDKTHNTTNMLIVFSTYEMEKVYGKYVGNPTDVFSAQDKTEKKKALMITVSDSYEPISVIEGDVVHIAVVVDKQKRVDILLPDVSGKGTLKLYVAEDGSTFYDVDLTKPACLKEE